MLHIFIVKSRSDLSALFVHKQMKTYKYIDSYYIYRQIYYTYSICMAFYDFFVFCIFILYLFGFFF